MKKLYMLSFWFLLTLLSFSQTPTLIISDGGPANGSTFVDDPETATPGNATIDFVTTNFNVGQPGTGTQADGYIIWTAINTVTPANNDGGTIYTANEGDPITEYNVNGLIAGQTYDFRAELVDNSGAPLTPIAAVYTFTITIAAYTDVANLAALRTQTVDPDLYYRVLGQVINTFSRGSNDNQQYFQDTSAGILVFDDGYEVSTYNKGDVITNIRGHLEETANNGLIFRPTFTDWGSPTSTGASPGIQTLTIQDIYDNLDSLEGELVKIEGASYTGVLTNFTNSTQNYLFDDGTNTMALSTFFTEVDYVAGTFAIPSAPQDIIGIITDFNDGTPTITPRSSADFSNTLSADDFELDAFKMYPNPTSLGYINISSKISSKMEVSVFSVLGKQIINETVINNRLEVSNLNAGIYILKASQDHATSTKKLIIK